MTRLVLAALMLGAALLFTHRQLRLAAPELSQAWERRGRAEMIKRNREYKWQEQPCILQAKIDPSLSIEAYYRQQEAKGIQATPKGDDFDNVHRR